MRSNNKYFFQALAPLITMIAHDWIKLKSSDERDVMIHYAQIARLIIAFSYFVMISSLIILIIASAFGYTLRHVITDSRPLPLQAYYIYNTSVSPQFEITFFIQCISLMMIALSYTSIDTFFGLLIFHICGQFENLTKRLCRMRKSKDFTAALRINIVDHIRLIRFILIMTRAIRVFAYMFRQSLYQSRDTYDSRIELMFYYRCPAHTLYLINCFTLYLKNLCNCRVILQMIEIHVFSKI